VPTRSGPRHTRSRIVALVIVLVLAGLGAAPARAQSDDPAIAEAVARCEELLPALRDAAWPLRRAVEGLAVTERTGVRLDWTEPGFRGRPRAAWLVCWFYPRTETNGVWQFVQAQSDRYGLLRRYDIQQLYKFLRVRPAEAAAPAQPDTPARRLAVAAQQGINAASLGCLYALIAVGFALVYGVTGVANFAFGELYMLGAFLALLGELVFRPPHGTLLPDAVFLLAPFVMLSLAAHGLAMDRLVFRRLRGTPTSVALIAAIGLSLALKEYVRLLQGPRSQWLPFNPDPLVIATGTGFDLVVSRGHILVGLAALAVALLLWWTLARTRLGRALRATAEDPRAAQLLGVDTERTIGLAYALGAGLAGAAGLFAAVQYGLVDASMGTLVGFKALTAAILGGIGSLPGAVLGGFLIAATEVGTAATVGSEWKDVAVFGILVLVLVFRPEGLLGEPAVARV
jgi:branched-chain amino acid transport system permease protein